MTNNTSSRSVARVCVTT